MFDFDFKGNPAIKDSIEALGIPHTEVEAILVNHRGVGFDYQMRDGDRAIIYPYDILPEAQICKLRPDPPQDIRFILDIHLAALARNLRMLGFDTLHGPQFNNRDLVRLALDENRILVSRSRALLKQRCVIHGICLWPEKPDEQTRAVIRRYALDNRIKPFSRCISCNGIKEPVDKNALRDKIPPRTAERYTSFSSCPACAKIYWDGSHYEKMLDKIARILEP